ncbi:MAG: tripartite tricarboxylate transporter substrate binding protein [Betaproteobacteria bacterium]
MKASIKRAALALAVLAVLSGNALAQGTYPNKPVKMIVPFAPGGASDFVARVLVPRMSELLGQQVVVENRAGAGGNIGMEAGAKSPPDGYTLYLGNIGTIAINPALYSKLSVDTVKDFQAVTQVVDLPSVLVINSSSAVASVSEFVAQAKASPGKLNYGSPGSGTMNRLEMEMLRRAAGLDMVHVPYSGGAGPAVAGVVAGETQVMFTTMPSAIGMIRGGRLKALATTSPKRTEQLAAVPTMVEAGFADFVTSSWQGIFVPAGTPKDVVERLYAALVQTLQTPDVIERLGKSGVSAVTSASPQAFGEFVANEHRRWGRVARDANATVD